MFPCQSVSWPLILCLCFLFHGSVSDIQLDICLLSHRVCLDGKSTVCENQLTSSSPINIAWILIFFFFFFYEPNDVMLYRAQLPPCGKWYFNIHFTSVVHRVYRVGSKTLRSNVKYRYITAMLIYTVYHKVYTNFYSSCHLSAAVFKAKEKQIKY